MARLALVYQDDFEKTNLILVGKITADRMLNAEDILDTLEIDMDEFAAEQGWDGWNPDQLDVIDASDDDEVLDSIGSGDMVPTLYANIETPNGMRSIEIPAIGEWFEALRLVDSELADADCNLVDITKTAEYPQYSKEDLEEIVWKNGEVQE